jgi:outer membrane lipoprotein-sorting protein
MTFAGGVPRQITLMTQSKMQVSITLSLVSLNEALPSALFQFEMPEGTDVIDDR